MKKKVGRRAVPADNYALIHNETVSLLHAVKVLTVLY